MALSFNDQSSGLDQCLIALVNSTATGHLCFYKKIEADDATLENFLLDGPKQSLNEVMLIYMDLACAYSFCHLFFLGYLGHPIFALVDKICLL